MYLVQRMIRKDKDLGASSGSIDDCYRMDYMGSSEFEDGSLGRSLNRMLAEWGKYEIFKLHDLKNCGGEEVWLFCKPEIKEEYIGKLWQLSNDEVRLKERSNFRETLYKDNHFGTPTDAWWDIKNDVMWVIGGHQIDYLTCALKNTLYKRLIKGGKTKAEATKIIGG